MRRPRMVTNGNPTIRVGRAGWSAALALGVAKRGELGVEVVELAAQRVVLVGGQPARLIVSPRA